MTINKYQSGKIYKITNTINSEVYVGSSTIDLEDRMIKHKNFAKKKPYASNLHKLMNELGVENFEIELVENCPCESQEELEKREGEIIKDIGTLNQKVVGRSDEEKKERRQEYDKNNRDKRNKQRNERRKANPEKTKNEYKKYGKLYREKHPEKIKEWKQTRVECECGGSYCLGDKSQHLQSKKHLKALGLFNEEEYKQSKQYQKMKTQYEKSEDKSDKEEMKEYKQNYYQNKKDEISQEAKQRILCDCGVEVCKGAYTRHLKSKLHKDYLNNNIANVSGIQEEANNIELQKTDE